MRLRKVKLSGFKSFVDPTTLSVPGNLVGIVGPNGCGKSNIIDAVMWVMGESSAKYLRGENLTDVIFNGSNTRQPIGQASVELVFDNSEHKIGGQYASYNEISIRRQLDREGVSGYFLNGTRCRRKDIQSIFLGTGLGPRSYAIIEQGMISRLIEARPEELRTFIEEAAGISKYRERRRETENRMRHTRENLARLNDIREELEQQLEHLQRQARAAERYQALKEEERRLRAELLVLNWHELQGQAEARNGVVRENESRVEEQVAALRAVEAEIERLRESHATENEAYSACQARFYEIGSQISQLEQKIQHAQERIQTHENELDKTRAAATAAEQQAHNDRDRLRQLSEDAEALAPKLDGSRSESNGAYDALTLAETALQAWQNEWDACNEAAAALNQQGEVDATREVHLQENLEEAARRRDALATELETLGSGKLPDALAERQKEAAALERRLEACRQDLEKRQKELDGARSAQEKASEALAGLRIRQEQLGGELQSLAALRDPGSADSEHFRSWLDRKGLARAQRLANAIQVEPRWTLALETVLGEHLESICSQDFPAALGALAELQEGSVGFVSVGKTAPARDGVEMLRDKVSGPWRVDGLLAGVRVAADLNAAVKMRAALQPGESVVTPDGIWMGPDWVRANRPVDREGGILVREQRGQEIEKELSGLAGEISTVDSGLRQRREEISTFEKQVAAAQRLLQETQERVAGARAAVAETGARAEESRRREKQIEAELESLDLQSADDRHELASVRARLERTGDDRISIHAQRDKLVALRDRHREALDDARARWQSTHQHSHEIALRLESISSQRASLEQAMQRTGLQAANLGARIAELETAIEAARGPVAEQRHALEARLGEKVDAEKALAGARERLQELDNGVRDKERERTECEQRIEEQRSTLEAARLAAREIVVRVRTVEEQLQSSGHDPRVLLESLDVTSATASDWQEKLAATERRIQRLGPINLAAIEEYQQRAERKEYLDRQHADLNEALTTLENAIRKIDRESRTRFQETFDRLNNNLKEMFPVLFGGGHAYLELTGEDLLETGVTIMARPPGKRNSTIHLLSGGEKALTAVALVFAIFKLNPAPFCILDEVDAPLDDTNTFRFSRLLSEMSSDVQFIFITHNKITMEIAHQLLGVTMQEAGVSRLVSVDVEEAVELAATA